MKLFVYGTLQSNYGNNVLLRGGNFLGAGLTIKPYVLVNCGFPMAIPFSKDEEVYRKLPVKGEVWEVGSEQLRQCDLLEGHPNWYVRTPVQVLMDNGSIEEANIYEMPDWEDHRLCSIVDDKYYLWSR